MDWTSDSSCSSSCERRSWSKARRTVIFDDLHSAQSEDWNSTTSTQVLSKNTEKSKKRRSNNKNERILYRAQQKVLKLEARQRKLAEMGPEPIKPKRQKPKTPYVDPEARVRQRLWKQRTEASETQSEDSEDEEFDDSASMITHYPDDQEYISDSDIANMPGKKEEKHRGKRQKKRKTRSTKKKLEKVPWNKNKAEEKPSAPKTIRLRRVVFKKTK